MTTMRHRFRRRLAFPSVPSETQIAALLKHLPIGVVALGAQLLVSPVTMITLR